MKPIKCLLLLAAVAFAAMNAAAMNIEDLVNDAIDEIRNGVPHMQNRALGHLINYAQNAIDRDIPIHRNTALAGLAVVVDAAAERKTEHNHPNMYVAQDPENEDVEICRSFNHTGFFRCVSCCFVKGHTNQARWMAQPSVYMDFQGRCSCELKDGDPPTEKLYRGALRIYNGEVINPMQRLRNNRN
jgi:hypothetical protein